MTEENITAVDKAVMIASGALVVLGMPVAGILVTITGSMSPMVTWAKGDSTGHALSAAGIPEGAQVVSSPLILPNTRALLLVIAVLLLGLLALYKLFQSPAEPAPTPVGASSEN
ncbi:MAG: hypothetical protein ABEJ58_08670 [Halodesulfurarchaeum sp.]